MIEYSRHELSNGLRVLLHHDETTPLVTVNTLCCVGARDEQPHRTGFAHLFEHLMFGGTRRQPDFDAVVDALGGESNAFTNNDYTNYYLTLPAQNLRQGLQLEVDRLRGDWDADGDRWPVLEVQKQVVTEEYHQRYLGRPYGDVWMLLRPLCYRVHPYRWCTIGADIRHVQEATLEEVRHFYQRYYRPDNLILSIAGHLQPQEALAMVEEVYGDLDPTPAAERLLPPRMRPYPAEPPQTEARRLEVERDVPATALYMAWPMCDRWNADFYLYDTLSDLLSNGHSSRLYRRLVQERHLFAEVDAYITGDLGPGLFCISGKLANGVEIAEAEVAINEEVRRMQEGLVDLQELRKVANKFENTFVYSQYKASDRALELSYFEMLGMTERVNTEPHFYQQIAPFDVQRVAQALTPNRCSTLVVRKRR